ncbi:MAG: hypothetical protein ACM3O7_04525 [Acidobacteriota bacterium]
MARFGYTIHWDCFDSQAEAERLVRFALANGAGVLNVVPPPRIWEQPESLATLRRIFRTARRRGVTVMLNRIDGSSFAPPGRPRDNLLFGRILTELGRLPDGSPTPDFFLATVGNPAYQAWLEEETRYYAEHFSGEPALGGFSIGPFNEPFVSQRGSLLCWSPSTGSYEIGQYTPYLRDLWGEALRRRFDAGLAALNARFGTSFASFEEVPLPVNEHDPRFPRAAAAYWQLVSTVNQWVVDRYEACRSIWHAHARRRVPFVLQFSGYVPEKFEKGRLAFAALDIFDWMARADALGVSLYTNCEYPDWGHASDAAMVNFLRLGKLLGKPVFVLEEGNECNGAILDHGELGFLRDQARLLAPATVIYEFLRSTYYESSPQRSGRLLSPSWTENAPAVTAVSAALREAATPGVPPRVVYVADDAPALATDPAALQSRWKLMQAALRMPIVFVPVRVLDAVPSGSTLVVLAPLSDGQTRRLQSRGVLVTNAGDVLGEPVGGAEGAGAPPRD